VLQLLTSSDFPLAPCRTSASTATGAIDDNSGTTMLKQEQCDGLQPSILDLGTGNGSMLALLRYNGHFTGPMVGIDYSSRSVQLARELQRLRRQPQQQRRHHNGDDAAVCGGYESEKDLHHSGGEEANGEAGEADGTSKVTMAATTAPEIWFEEWNIFNRDDALSTNELSTKNRLNWFPYERGGFDIVLDKGTFDAVSLSAEILSSSQELGSADSDRNSNGTNTNEGEGERDDSSRKNPVRLCELYPRIATKLVRKAGFLVVTSCNWTEDELIRWFIPAGAFPASAANTSALLKMEEKEQNDGGGFDVWGRVEYPRFRFGGQEGQGVCTVCFQRKNNRKQ
jgi:EEF1A lysine methyltransferase 2